MFRRFKTRPRPRHVPGAMNKTEARYAAYLEALKQTGDILDYRYEPVKLKLADRTYYTPDFMVLTDCIELHEVKAQTSRGRVLTEDDAAVKIKVAAEQFPWLMFKRVSIGTKGTTWRVDLYESTLNTEKKEAA